MSGLITCTLGDGARAEMQRHPQHSEIGCLNCAPLLKRTAKPTKVTVPPQ